MPSNYNDVNWKQRKAQSPLTCHLWHICIPLKLLAYLFFRESADMSGFSLLGSRLKGHGNEADFLGFLQKLGPHRSLTLPFKPFRFWLWIQGDIGNRKTTPRLGELVSRRLSDSASRGVVGSLTRRVGESTTHRLAESGNRLLNVEKKNRRVGESDSPTRLIGESLTPGLGELESRRLPDSLSQGVAMVSRGVAIQIFLNLASIFRTFNG